MFQLCDSSVELYNILSYSQALHTLFHIKGAKMFQKGATSMQTVWSNLI